MLQVNFKPTEVMVQVAHQIFYLGFHIGYILANDQSIMHQDNIVDIAMIFSTEIVLEMAYLDGDLLRVFGCTLSSAEFIYGQMIFIPDHPKSNQEPTADIQAHHRLLQFSP
jgi:hypothetical protein